MASTPKRPAGLGPRGSRLWRDVIVGYTMNPGEAELLVEACRTADMIDQLRARLDRSELVVAGSMGQERVNPLATSLSAAQDGLRKLLVSLGLPPVEVIEVKPLSRLEEMRQRRRELGDGAG